MTEEETPIPDHQGNRTSARPVLRQRIKRSVLGVLGFLISVALITNVFFRLQLRGGLSLTSRFQFGTWVEDLPSHLYWLAAFVALTAMLIPLRAMQWGFTLGERPPSFRSRYHAVAIGAFAHNVLPGNVGDVARSWLLARHERISFFHTLAAVVVCKLLELAALIVVVASSLLIPREGGGAPTASLASSLPIAVLLFAGLLALLLLTARFAPSLALRLERRRLPRVRLAVLHIADGLHAIKSPRRAALAFLVSTLPVLASSLGYGIALQALGVPRGILSGGIVLGAIALGQLAIGLPVGTGMYYLLCTWAARALGASASEAAALAVLTHLATFTTQTTMGAVSLLLDRKDVRELLRRRKTLAADAARADVEGAESSVHA